VPHRGGLAAWAVAGILAVGLFTGCSTRAHPGAPSSTQTRGLVDHGAFIYAYSPDDLAHIVYFHGVQPAALAADLRRLAAGALPAT
jgi:hypothetical protein